jgi:homoserine dehydrogenase
MTSTNSNDSKTPLLRIGMFGGGTVGGGVYELLQQQQRSVVVTHICVRDVSKPRDFVLDAAVTTLTDQPSLLLDNPDIDCVVEVMGGTTLAKTIVLKALAAGKSVVTANKALLAEHLDEILQAVTSAATAAASNSNSSNSNSNSNNTPQLAYEAAVCGGIPIIHLLQSSYSADQISTVAGICNGTTNFMLCAMEQGADYGVVLKQAQDLGYAEADPAADVEGWDVRAKICLLSHLAFGQTVLPVEDIPCQGIANVAAVDFEYAAIMKATIKLVGTATVNNDTNALSVYVSPVMVAQTHLLASARGSGNAVAVTSDNMGTCAYTGPGAGRFPTANSVVADIYRIAAGQNPAPRNTGTSTATTKRAVDLDYSAKFYIRIPYADSLGIIRSVGALAEKHGVSIHSILQNPMEDPAKADFCLTTDQCRHSAVTALCAEIAKQDYARGAPLAMPLMLER